MRRKLSPPQKAWLAIALAIGAWSILILIAALFHQTAMFTAKGGLAPSFAQQWRASRGKASELAIIRKLLSHQAQNDVASHYANSASSCVTLRDVAQGLREAAVKRRVPWPECFVRGVEASENRFYAGRFAP